MLMSEESAAAAGAHGIYAVRRACNAGAKSPLSFSLSLGAGLSL
jgi:hypothetical protein